MPVTIELTDIENITTAGAKWLGRVMVEAGIAGPGPTDVLKTVTVDDDVDGEIIYEYCGTISASDFLGSTESGDDGPNDKLSSDLGLTAGTAFNHDADWVKYTRDGKVCYMAKKPLRYNLSWNDINGEDAVDGTAEVTYGDYTYKVRLMWGGDSDPGTSYGVNEWNTVMYSLVDCVDDGHLGEDAEGSDGKWEEWGNDAVGIGGDSNPDGRTSWCQEVSGNNSVNRGWHSVSDWRSHHAMFAFPSRGWRPVLELKED